MCPLILPGGPTAGEYHRERCRQKPAVVGQDPPRFCPVRHRDVYNSQRRRTDIYKFLWLPLQGEIRKQGQTNHDRLVDDI